MTTDAAGLPGEPIVASILIVDDNPANLVALEAVLEPLGQRIVRARSGAEALARLLDEEFAVILLDVQMEDLDGFKTAALIKQRRQSQHVPIIFITAGGVHEGDVEHAYAQGGVDFLRKPYDPDVLRAKVGVFVDLYVQRQQIERQAELLRERERFIGILGHDLRTPLGAIVLRAGSLLRQKNLSEPSRASAEGIARSAARMARMIDDLVDFTRSRHGGIKLVRKPVDLAALAREVLEETRVAHPDRAIEFAAEGDGTGRWDPDRLAQVVQNLVSNALAYSPADSPVLVAVRAAEGGPVTLAVTNQGPPIPSAAMATLFDPFKRARRAGAGEPRAAVASGPGLGLGLYIVDQIVRAHAGAVRVTSEAEAGTTFAVELPRGGGAAG